VKSKHERVFYPLGVKRGKVPVVAIEIPILLAAPGESATFQKPNTLDVVIQAIIANSTPKKFTKGKYDYMDANEFFGGYGFPKSYDGFSGGGLWHIYVYLDREQANAKNEDTSLEWHSTNLSRSASTQSFATTVQRA